MYRRAGVACAEQRARLPARDDQRLAVLAEALALFHTVRGDMARAAACYERALAQRNLLQRFSHPRLWGQ